MNLRLISVSGLLLFSSLTFAQERENRVSVQITSAGTQSFKMYGAQYRSETTYTDVTTQCERTCQMMDPCETGTTYQTTCTQSIPHTNTYYEYDVDADVELEVVGAPAGMELKETVQLYLSGKDLSVSTKESSKKFLIASEITYERSPVRRGIMEMKAKVKLIPHEAKANIDALKISDLKYSKGVVSYSTLPGATLPQSHDFSMSRTNIFSSFYINKYDMDSSVQTTTAEEGKLVHRIDLSKLTKLPLKKAKYRINVYSRLKNASGIINAYSDFGSLTGHQEIKLKLK